MPAWRSRLVLFVLFAAFLALAVRAACSNTHAEAVTWEQLLPLLATFWELVCLRLERRQQAGRLKQWLQFLRLRYPDAEAGYAEVRTLTDPVAVGHWLRAQPGGSAAAH